MLELDKCWSCLIITTNVQWNQSRMSLVSYLVPKWRLLSFLEKHHFLVGFLTILYVELMGLDLLVDTSFSYYHTKLSLFSSWKNVSLMYNHPQLYFNFFVEKIRKRLSLPPPMTLASF